LTGPPRPGKHAGDPMRQPLATLARSQRWLVALCLPAILGFECDSQGGGAPGRAAHPNVVLIVADDLGWGDVGYTHSQVRTPNINRLAEEGITLRRFYTAPYCTPTRAALLSGRSAIH